jgi:hypothetical protein
MYSFIPSGEAAQACHASPEIAQIMAALASVLRKLIIAHPPTVQIMPGYTQTKSSRKRARAAQGRAKDQKTHDILD